MLAVVIAYLLGVGTGLLCLLLPRDRETEEEEHESQVGPPRRRSREAVELEEVVTEFGEELAQLTFAPGAPGVSAESVADYRRALDSYEKAKDALLVELNDLGPVRQALATGRNALIRLSARNLGRPVPIDISHTARSSGAPAEPQPHQDMRFSYSGSNTRPYVIPIDWPEPGQPAIMAMTRNGTGSSGIETRAITTEGSDGNLIRSFWLNGSMRGRFYLPTTPDELTAPTHLKISPGKILRVTGSWSLHLLPLAEAVELRGEHQGVGSEVLFHRSDGPVTLGIHMVTTNSWEVEFRCRRRHRHSVRCPRGNPRLRGMAEALESITVCGYGVIIVKADESARWSLSVSASPSATLPSRAADLRRWFRSIL